MSRQQVASERETMGVIITKWN